MAKIRHEEPKVIDIHCIFHLVNHFVKSAVKAFPLKVDEIIE